jgi:UDP-N-acetylmuramoylalanine--D-glutamate ligase
MASGNIGTAFSTAVRDSANLDVMVLEVSSFQLEHIVDFRPRISVHLNLTPDHLDRYGSMEEYEVAKWQVFRNQTVDDYAVVNVALRLPEMAARKITFSATGAPADYQLIDGWLVAHGEQVLEQSRTNLIGQHNAENMLAALAVADLYNVARDKAVDALCKYLPLPHRCEKIAEIGGITFLNDSKATNIDALEKALIAMRSPVVLLAGGKDKGLDFSSLRPLLREKVKAVVLIGQMTEKLYAAWNSAVPCHRATTLADAVAQCHQLARAGDVVLFSPGCSSYDMFKSFEDRGDQFRALVQAKAK